MSIKRLSVALSIFFTLHGEAWAATLAAQGTIRFQGSIVEPNCVSHAGLRAIFELNACPSPTRTTTINVSSVAPVSEPFSVNLKLLSDSGRDGRYYNQQYELVDKSGTPILSGSYIVTISVP